MGPTIKQIQNWLQQRRDITDFSIKNITTRFVLNKFLKHGSLSNVQVVFHGSGNYCSPCINTAGGYQRGSLFVCLVRADKCRKSGSIYVVPHDDDILPVYLASFNTSYCYGGGGIPGNILMSFVPGWQPLNVDEKASKERRVKRKWSAYHKLAE